MRPFYLLLLIALISSCSQKQPVDLIVYNATIYTVDSTFSMAEALAVKDGKLIAIGKNQDIQDKYDAKSKTDAGGKFIYPGLIDAHTHFYMYALGLNTLDVVGTSSWDEVIVKLSAFAAAHPQGWLIGRGWDQNDWTNKVFPSKEKLDSLFPDRPVLLTRVDGHAAIVNQRALDEAGIQPGKKLMGGEIETRNGKLTGILIDNAVDLVSGKIPVPTEVQTRAALQQAQRNCFQQGLTTLDDCGIDYKDALRMDSLQKNGDLKMRLFVMLSDNRMNFDYLFANGKYKSERLHINAFKVYADGALGSRGACLLAPYADKPGHYGFLLSNPEHFDSVARVISEKEFQMCTHAIGDSGNRTILNIYARYLSKHNDRRWRIEHAQVINEHDFHLFGDYNVIPSVQPTHATSDMYWAGTRLGGERVKGAYAYKQLLDQNAWLPLGTDFPVEDISPFKTFYAAVARKDAKGWPENGFQVENALSREQALRGMTIWAARSNFEEKEKGSLEAGKFADFIILDDDLMKMPLVKVLQLKVLKTFLNGELVYQFN